MQVMEIDEQWSLPIVKEFFCLHTNAKPEKKLHFLALPMELWGIFWFQLITIAVAFFLFHSSAAFFFICIKIYSLWVFSFVFFWSLVCLALDWFALLVWYCKWTKKFNEFRERKRAIFHLHIFVKCLHDSNVLCLWMWRKRQTDTWTNGPTDRQTDWQKGCVCVASVYFYFNVQWSHYIVSAGCVRHGNMNMMIFAHVECYWMVT